MTNSVITNTSKLICTAKVAALNNSGSVNAFTFNISSRSCQFGFVDPFKVINTTQYVDPLPIYHLHHIDGGFEQPYDIPCNGTKTQCICPVDPLERENVICSRPCHKAFPRQDAEYADCLDCCQGCCTNLPHCPSTWAFSIDWAFKCRCTTTSKVAMQDVLYSRAAGNCDFYNTDCPQLKYPMNFYVNINAH